MKQLICSLALALACSLPVAAQDAAGRAAMVVGVAYAIDANGAQRRLSRGDSVFPGETIGTQRHSYVNIIYSDRGRTLVGPQSEIKIEDYSYTQPASGGPRTKGGAVASDDGGVGRSVFSLLKGGLRAVTGLIGRNSRDAYSLKTAVATIGIRGTDYFVVVCEEQCQNLGLPAGVDPKGGIVLGVHEGGIFAVNAQGERFELNENQFLLVTTRGEFHQLPGEPAFMLSTPMQDPETCN